ncbi:MAG: GTPase [Candidatus Saccharibacteria bacterium]
MKTLIFVYNAESGMTNALLDVGRRVFTPESYPCSLCAVTYGPFGMKKDWKEFTRKLPYEVTFLHKDELPKAVLSKNLTFPSLVLKNEDGISVLIDGAEFKKILDLESLKTQVSKALSSHIASNTV